MSEVDFFFYSENKKNIFYNMTAVISQIPKSVKDDCARVHNVKQNLVSFINFFKRSSFTHYRQLTVCA